MGGSNSISNFGYGRVAAIQWYAEGSRLYGRSGYENKLGGKRASWYPTPCKTTLAPFYFGLWEAAQRLSHLSSKRRGSSAPSTAIDPLVAPSAAFAGSEGSEEQMKKTMARLVEEAIATHSASLDPSTYRKRVLITGSNRGLGFTSALAIARLGAEVHLACRSIPRGNEAKEKLVAELKEDLSKVARYYLGQQPIQASPTSVDFIAQFYPQSECELLHDQIRYFIHRNGSTPVPGSSEFVADLLSKENFVDRLAPLLEAHIVVHECDCGDFGSVRKFSEKFLQAYDRLDVLIHNAGVMLEKYTYAVDSSKVPSVSRDDPKNTPETSEMSLTAPQDAYKEATMATMLGGTMLMTELLLPALAAAYDASVEASKTLASTEEPKYPMAEHGARVINVASGGLFAAGSPEGDIQFSVCAPPGGPLGDALVDDKKKSAPKHKFDGTLLYAYTKRAQVILTEQWPVKIRAQLSGSEGTAGYRAISFYTTHPGWVATGGVETSMPEFYAKNKDTLRTEMQGSDTVAFLASVRGDQIVNLHASFETSNGVDGVPIPILPSLSESGHNPQGALSQGLFWFDREPTSKHKKLSSTRSTKESDERLWVQCREFCDLTPDCISLKK
jgi:NAD(P)-dependent dehydrogenase (short-subunit alcohol dehydrogenase family)